MFWTFSLFGLFIFVGGIIFWGNQILKIKDSFNYILFPFLIAYSAYYKIKCPAYKENQDHVAIIVPYRFKVFLITYYMDGVDILIRCFFKNNIPYKVYDCNSSKKFISIVKNPRVKEIHVFGHGQRHGLIFNKKDILYYCEFNMCKKDKNLVAQWHCNNRGGKSLGEYISKKSLADKNMRNSFQNRRDIYKFTKRYNSWGKKSKKH